MLSFENTEIAFKGKSTKDLKQARFLFNMIRRPWMVKVGKWLINFALAIRLPINGIIKRTIFKQFCGGVSINDSLLTSDDLAQRGVKTILDYSIEGKTKEEDFDKTVNEIIKTIEQAKQNENIPFAVFKVTGITLFETLEYGNSLTENEVISSENESVQRLIQRIDKICNAAYTADVPLFIDAEESWIQNTIDNIVRHMSRKYNSKRAIVFNTIQLYRHDRLAFMRSEIELARNENWFIGLKLVRGAYMEKERERAAEQGYPSPIQPDKESCDKDFDAAIKMTIDNIDVVSVCAGTHNEESSMLLVELLKEKGIKSDDPRVYFAQLLGMSDHISFNLAHHEMQVAKYVPYGPIREVMPYLIRRAEENTSVAGQTGRELALILKEIKRRKSNR
jgi:proline dehydrogenase